MNSEDLYLVGGDELGSVAYVDDERSWTVERFATLLTVPLYMGGFIRKHDVNQVGNTILA